MKSTVPRRAASLAPVLAAVLFLACAHVLSDAARNALSLCARVLIPSLFPYMVISSMIVSLGAAETLGRPLATLTRRFLRLPGAAAGAMLLGALCGFPIGAKAACELFRRGTLSREQAERLIAAANNTGPAFLIEIVGIRLWHSASLGMLLYTLQLFLAFLIAAAAARRAPIPPKESNGAAAAPAPSLFSSFADAIEESASATLGICGMIVFFACLLSLAERLLTAFSLETLLPAAAAVLEFSAGTGAAAVLGGRAGLFLTGFAVGFSGLSVFAQSMRFTAPLKLSLHTAFFSKLLQGLLLGGAAAWLGASSLAAPAAALKPILYLAPPTPWMLTEIGLLILFCLFPVIFQKRT